MKLNPNGVVPTLVHDGRVVTKSSLILYYIDEAFPDPSLMPEAPAARHRVRLYNKLVDEYVHNACTILTFATAFRPRFLKMSREQWLAEINKAPLKRRVDYKRSVIEHGLDSEYVRDAFASIRKLSPGWPMTFTGPYLSGEAFSNADCAVIPYILRLELLKLGELWRKEPSVVEWWARVRNRPSVQSAIFDRMRETDWAPFRNLAPDPWPKVSRCSRPPDSVRGPNPTSCMRATACTPATKQMMLKSLTAHNSICTQKRCFLMLIEKGFAVDNGVYRSVQQRANTGWNTSEAQSKRRCTKPLDLMTGMLSSSPRQL